jgi:hypothetical protein
MFGHDELERAGAGMAGRTVAIMQPYFAPYAGYWRLLAGVDLFVIYDCVQFPRRGWVHRNRLADAKGDLQWLTLPLAHAPFDARIDEVGFSPDAEARMAERARAFPALAEPPQAALDYLHAGRFAGAVADYLAAQIACARDQFGFGCELLRSSTLGLDENLKAQDRILAVLAAVGGDDYLNAPGGRELYDPETFAARGVRLRFLPDWQGGYESVLQRLAQAPPSAIRAEILAQTPQREL